MPDVIELVHEDQITSYEEFSAGLSDAVSGDTIRLIEDIENVSSLVNVDKSIVLDLNGHTYSTITNRKVDGFCVVSGGSLTLVDSSDSSDSKSGKLITSRNGILVGSTTSYADSNEFIMNSGYMETQEFGVAVFGNGHVQINGGKIYARDNGAVGANGSAKYAPYPYLIEINSGELVADTQSAGYANCGLYASNAGLVKISGGTIVGKQGAGVVLRGGSLIVDGGVISGEGDTQGLRMGDANPTFCGGIEIGNSCNYPGKVENIEINGGEISSLNFSAVAVIGDPSDPQTPNSKNSTVILNGGAYSGGTSSIDYVDANGNQYEDVRSSNLSIYGGQYNTDISKYLSDDVDIKKIVNPDGSVSYLVENPLAEISKNTSDLVESSNKILNDVEEISSTTKTVSDKVSNIDSSISTINQNIEESKNSLSSLNESSIQTNSQLQDIGDNSEDIKNQLSGLGESLSNIKDTTEAISNSMPSSVKPKTEDEIYQLMIKTLVDNAIKTGETRAIWQHRMNPVVKQYCDDNGYKLTPFVGVNTPARIGDQWLVIISE